MQRVRTKAPQVESALETLVENTIFSRDVAKKAEQRLSSRNFAGVGVNPDVDMLKVAKAKSIYIQESHSKKLRIGGQDVNFGRLGKFVVIGRHPESGNLYFAPIVDSGSTPSASINDVGTKASPGISRLDLLMVKGSGAVEFFNLGKNEAIIEAEDKF